MFQSPCGEEVMKAGNSDVEINEDGEFQSPCGEEVMKVGRKFGAEVASEISSFSPLAGKR